jgi:hypothetical protein
MREGSFPTLVDVFRSLLLLDSDSFVFIADFFLSLFLLDSDWFEFIVDEEFLELLSNPKDGLIDSRSLIFVCRFLIGSLSESSFLVVFW